MEFQASLADCGVRRNLLAALPRQSPTLPVCQAIMMLWSTRKVSVPISPYKLSPIERVVLRLSGYLRIGG